LEFATIWALRSAISGTDFLFTAGILMVAEGLMPRESHSVKSRLRGAVFWLILIPTTTCIVLAFQMLLSRIGITPLIPADKPGWLPYWGALLLGPLGGLLIGDFFFYWHHRAEHVFLWRFHRVHHSIRELNVLASYYHPTEEIWRSVLIVLPMALLIQWNASEAYISILIFRLQTLYIHSSARIQFGPLSYLLMDNRFHRIHHSTSPEHFDKNFGGITPLWDVLFGTAHFPAKGEWPETGLEDFPEPDGVADYILSPIRPMARPISQAGE